MKKNESDQLLRSFLLNEGVVNGTVEDYIKSVIDQLQLIKPATRTDERRLSVAKDNLRTIKRLVRQLVVSDNDEV